MIKIINNNVKLKIPLLIIFVAFVVAMWIDFAWTDISILQIKGIDEYAFHGSLLTMYKGIMSFDIRGVFSYGFYSYGSIYWILNVIIAFPFLDEVGEPLAIILPRIFSSLFMIFSLYLVVKVVAQNGSNTYKQVFILFTLLLMPGIWSMGTFFHPDFMMSALLLLSIYYLSRSKVIGDNSYWLSIIIWSFATMKL